MYTVPVFWRPILLTALLAAVLTPVSVLAQSPAGQLGNASVTPSSPSMAEPYGINSSVEGEGAATFGSRHHRQGNEGGIGSSFSGTTSATAESQSLARYASPASAPATTPAGSWPIDSNRPRTFSETMRYSPAVSPTHYLEPASVGASGAGDQLVESWKVESQSYDAFWGHQKGRESLQPSMGAVGGSQTAPK